MPGPGAHLLYTLSGGLALKVLTDNRFSKVHCFVYAINSLVGPDIGPVFELFVKKVWQELGSRCMDTIHHPLGYIVLLAFPLSIMYSSVIRRINSYFGSQAKVRKM